ncbi:hypothetical protein ABK040_015775 [Willaertia magna]
MFKHNKATISEKINFNGIVNSALQKQKENKLSEKTQNYYSFQLFSLHDETFEISQQEIPIHNYPLFEPLNNNNSNNLNKNLLNNLNNNNNLINNNNLLNNKMKKHFFKEIVCGINHCLVLLSDNLILTAGSNFNGQLGRKNLRNEKEFIFEPIDLFNNTLQKNTLQNKTVKKIIAGGNSSGILFENGKVIVFGCNEYFQINPFTNFTNIFIPMKIKYLKNIKLFSFGYNHSIFVIEDLENNQDIIYTFGNNDFGQLGRLQCKNSLQELFLNTTNNTITINNKNNKIYKNIFKFLNKCKVNFNNFTKIKSVLCGENCTSILTNNFECFCFGKGIDGNLSLSKIVTELLIVNYPMKIILPYDNHLQNVINLSFGYKHSLFQLNYNKPVYNNNENDNNNCLFSCGNNLEGQLGINNNNLTENILTPLKSTSFWKKRKGISSFHCGNNFSVILTRDLNLYICTNKYNYINNTTNYNISNNTKLNNNKLNNEKKNCKINNCFRKLNVNEHVIDFCCGSNFIVMIVKKFIIEKKKQTEVWISKICKEIEFKILHSNFHDITIIFNC